MSILKVPVSPDDHIQGNPDASVTLVEYGDYECPYCGMAYPVVQQVQEHFGEQLRFVFRNFPLAEVHPFAKDAAETAEFAADHDLFWEMHDLIFENQGSLNIPLLLELGKSLDLPVKELELAIRTQKYEPKIRKDFLSGLRSGVNGTPTFFINSQRHDGPFQYENLVSAIESVFAK